MITQTDLELADGRVLHVYDTGADGGARDLAVLWLHGTPSIGAPPEPLFPAAARLGIRWVSYDRPGYGGSTPRPGRDVASAAWDIAAVADSLGIDRFAVMGHSGGAKHALACGALLPDRVLAIVCVAGLAPVGADGLDWYAGMAPVCQAGSRAAAAGRAALEDYLISNGFDQDNTDADRVALTGAWSWLNTVFRYGIATDEGGVIDDDLATMAAWGFDPAQVTMPVLLLQGGQDTMTPSSHSQWLAGRCPRGELRLYQGDGHISVLRHSEAALDWVRDHVPPSPLSRNVFGEMTSGRD